MAEYKLETQEKHLGFYLARWSELKASCFHLSLTPTETMFVF